MATKSVIDIEINDEKFREFQKLFEKYQKSLDKMPGQWGKINKSSTSLQGNFDKIQHALDTVAKRLDKNYTTLQNTDRVAKSTANHFSQIGKNAAGIAKNVSSTTFNLLKWGSIGLATGLIGAGTGLFGLANLASNAGNTRKQAQGLGVTSGELKSAQVNYGKFATDPNALLGSIANAQTDINKQVSFQAAGINPEQSAFKIMQQALKKAGEVYKQGEPGTAQQRLEVSGLSALGIDVETARRMASLKQTEIDQTEKQANKDAKLLEATDNLLKRWQALDIQLNRSKEKIENTFLGALEGLVTPLEGLSEAFSNAIKTFLGDPKVKGWIKDAGEGIEKFSKYLTSPDFDKDSKEFLKNVQKVGIAVLDLADAIIWLAGFIKNPLNPDPEKNIVMTDKEAKDKGAIPYNPNLGWKEMLRGWNAYKRNLEKVNPQLADIAIENKLKVIAGGGYRSKEEEDALGKIKDANGQWRTKSGHLTTPPGVISKHTVGQAIDIDKKQAESLSDDDLAKMGLYRPYDDPTEVNHLELLTDEIRKKLEKEGKIKPVQQRSSYDPTSGQNVAMMPWNPTSISLDINTVKIPGQETNVNMLNAGGYYTGFRQV